jgi:inner membrane protein
LGYAFYTAFRRFGVQNLKLMGLCLLVANAADLDFLPGLLIGDPNRFHHGISHSIGFAALFALCGSSCRFMGPSFWKNFASLFCLYGSHVVIDYFSIDTSVPYGVPCFWPVTSAYYIAPAPFFPDIRRSVVASEFFGSLFTLHNLWAVIVESIVIAPILLILRVVRKR